MRGGLRIFGHPVHPVLVHFPIALWSASLLWDAIGLVRGEALWWSMSYWTIALGLGFSLPAMVAGFWDYASVDEHAPAHRPATWHMLVMSGAAVAFLLSLLVRNASAAPEGTNLTLALAASALGFGLLAWGGWLGGTLVYRHGVGAEHIGPENQP